LSRVQSVGSEIARLVDQGVEGDASLLVVSSILGVGGGLVASESDDTLRVSEPVRSNGGSLVEESLLSYSAVGSVADLVADALVGHGVSGEGAQEVSSSSLASSLEGEGEQSVAARRTVGEL